MIDPRTHDIVKRLAKDNNLSMQQVEDIKESMFRFIHLTIVDMDLASVKSQEELNKYKHTFNIPRIGKLYPSLSKIIKCKKDGHSS